jgi:hypothetical protein
MSWAGEQEHPANGLTVSEHSTVDVTNGTQPAAGEPEAEVVSETFAGDEHKVFLSLQGGERVEVGVFPNEQSAHAHAEDLMVGAAQATTAATWPRIDGRYFRPETIVSIDVERSDQPRWTGSTGRASSWSSSR